MFFQRALKERAVRTVPILFCAPRYNLFCAPRTSAVVKSELGTGPIGQVPALALASGQANAL